MKNFILSCGSTVDLPYSYCLDRDFRIIYYSYFIDGKEYKDDMGRTPGESTRYYAMLNEGKMPTTSQINEQTYYEFFDELLKEGDVLHVAFGSGMSGSVYNAIAAAKRAGEAHPDRRIEVIDSTCSSGGYGMIVDYAADMRDAGKTMDETIGWLNANRRTFHHLFFSTVLSFFRRSGRVKATAAFFGSILGICPLMRLNREGRIVPYDKALGKRKALQKTVKNVLAALPEHYDGKLWINHSNCPELAEEARAELVAALPDYKRDIFVFDIGPVISSHCGPGTVAIYFKADERQE